MLFSNFQLSLSITSHLMFVDGEYRCDDTLLYGYRSTHQGGGLAHYGESLAAHSFLQGTQPTREKDSRHSPSHTYVSLTFSASSNVRVLCRQHLIDDVDKGGCDSDLRDTGVFLLVLLPPVISPKISVGLPDCIGCLDQCPA